ncbi:MAG TPA: amino acid adenylation domain-containing protein [Vicinamibacterales bacterium]|nr:amino acid adenylation domain-containing protein [Vicinamibacterales bacterium]
MTLVQLLSEQVRRTPDAVAVIDGVERLSYAELDLRAERLAGHLHAAGEVGPGVPVAVCLPRSADLIVAVLAVLKTGSAYVPLDPLYPAERIAYILEESRARIVLTGRDGSEPPGHQARSVRVDLARDWAAPAAPRRVPDPRDLAYVLFTSGSTGRPKGVAIEHRAASAFVRWATSHFSAAELSRVAFVTSICFDLSVFEIWAPLTCGGAVVVAQHALDLAALPAAAELTLINTVPSALGEILDSSSPVLTATVNVAGEAVPESLVKRAFEQPVLERLNNLYGPTESTTYSTVACLHPSRSVRIGRPIEGTHAYVLDDRLGAVPEGESGELYLAGAGLARGYFNRPALTSERFVADPFGPPGTRMYRTGDRVRLECGELVFLGRLDQQVKLRGFRIELGEVEHALRDQPEVADAAAVVFGEGAAARIVAYVLAPPDVDPRQLRSALSARLPAYMVPSSVVRLAAWPRTPNGKLDRAKLPAPAHEGVIESDSESPHVDLLCAIVREVLSVPAVSPDDDFFEIGGHSLAAMRLVSRAQRVFGVALPVVEVFQYPKMRDLAEWLAARLAVPVRPFAPVEPARRPAAIPLSYEQERLWFLHQLYGDSRHYHMGLSIRLDGVLDLAALQRALDKVIERHEILRTRVARRGTDLVQEIEPRLSVPIAAVDLTDKPEREALDALKKARAADERPFDLENDALLRMRVVTTRPAQHHVIRTAHHLVSDGWSERIFRRELLGFYDAYRGGRDFQPDPLPAQYADYALWQREHLGDLSEGLAYWRRQLEGMPFTLSLPTARPRPPIATHAGDICTAELTTEQSDVVRGFSKEHHLTFFMTALGAVAIVLARYSGQEDMAIGSPVSSRPDSSFEPLIGFFVNTLVLRLKPEARLTIAEFMRELRQTALGAYSNRHVPFDRLVADLAPPRRLDLTPLFQVMFTTAAHLDVPRDADRPGVPAAPAGGGRMTHARFDMEFTAWQHDGRIGLSCIFNRDLFDREWIDQLTRDAVSCLRHMCASNDRSIDEVMAALTPPTVQVTAPASGALAPPVVATIEATARRLPTDPAIRFDGTDLTYGDLNRRADQLAGALCARGIRPSEPVAILLPPGPDCLVTLLGVLRTGAIALPLDLEQAGENISAALDSGHVKLVLTSERFRPMVPGDRDLWCVAGAELIGSAGRDLSRLAMRLPAEIHAEATACFVPAGTDSTELVAYSHRALSAMLCALNGAVSCGPSDRVVMLSPVSDPAFIFEFLRPLIAGATLIAPAVGELDYPEAIAALVERERPTQIWGSARDLCATAAALAGRIDAGMFVAVGEAPTPDCVGLRAQRLMPGRRVLSAPASGPYGFGLLSGPASTSDTVTAAAGVVIRVLDRQLRPVPVGVGGTIYIAGPSIAQGYAHLPARTAEWLVSDPYAGPGSRMARTRDVGCFRPDGGIRLLGRRTSEIGSPDLMSFLRIEDGLRLLPDVADAAVRHDRGETDPVAYVTLGGGAAKPFDPGAMLEELRGRLPSHLVPRSLVRLNRLPLRPDRTLDRSALPLTVGDDSGVEHADVERVVREAWSRVLQRDSIDRHDNFFSLGGHSLAAARIAVEVEAAFGVQVEIRDLFDHPTIASLGTVIDDRLVAQIAAMDDAEAERQVLALSSRDDAGKSGIAG